MSHKVYKAIIGAIRSGEIVEPFGEKEFREACPHFGEGTYKAFLHKHTKGNPAGVSELFYRVKPGKFRCIRPFLYDI